jgi:hypothetical protein
MSGRTPAPSPASTDSNCKNITAAKKLGFSAIGGAIFILVSLPFVYGFVDKIFGGNGIIANNETGAPTYTGIIVHAIVFTLLIWLTMEPWKDDRVSVLEEAM